MNWKAWYITTPIQVKILRFSSDIHTLDDLPSDGALAFKFDDLKLIGYDWYFFADGLDGLIFGADNEVRTRNIVEEIKNRYINVKLIRGIWVPSTVIDKVNMELWH